MTKMRMSDNQRDRILQFLAQGWPTSDIAPEVGVTSRQVAAIKAHVKMGSYAGMSTSVPSTTPTEEEIPDVEEILERLQANLSPIAIPAGREVVTKKTYILGPRP